LVLSLSSIGQEPGNLEIQGRSEELPELVELGCSGELTAKVRVVPTLTATLADMVVRGTISLDCGRCLEKLTGAFETKIRIIIEKKEEQGLEWVEDEGLGVDEYLARIGPDVLEIPLEHLIAEQIILNYNLNPLPTLDEKDKCIQCGRQAFRADPPIRKDRVDPRWEKLQDLKRRDEGAGEA
jgi:uncharacterized protein